MSRKAKVRTKSILSKIFCSLIYIVLFMPIAVVVVNSFNATTSKPYLTWKGFTFDWYVKLFENQSLLTSFGNTMIIAFHLTQQNPFQKMRSNQQKRHSLKMRMCLA